MTEYRTISDGYCEWLQYKAIVLKGFWIFKRIRVRWHYVCTDYYDYFDEQWQAWERKYGYPEGIRKYNRYINSDNTSIDLFVKKYPAVEKWLTERARVVNEKRSRAYEYHKQINLRIGAIKLFNQG